MIREDNDEAVLALTDKELELLGTVLSIVQIQQYDIHEEDQWFDTSEDLKTFFSLQAKVKDEKEFDPEQAEDWGNIGPPS